MSDLIPVHVCWNDRHGQPDKLVAVEFGMDCETCSLETDVLDGDPVDVSGHAFQVYRDEAARADSVYCGRFLFCDINTHVGNIHWDMLYMRPVEAGRFAEWLQERRHWSLNVAVTDIWNSWGSLSGREFVEILRKMEES